MADLRTLLSDLGAGDVVTLLNSGNAVFTIARSTASTLSRKIHESLHERLDVSVAVVVKTAADLAAIVAENPFTEPTVDPSRLLVAFAQESRSLKQLGPVAERVAAPERFHAGVYGAYLECPGGIHESRAAKALLGPAGREVTTRNWATTLKLQALLEARA
jgi:uncharacterized protein (DUF1697 family)